MANNQQNLEERVENLEQRVTALENQPIKTPNPNNRLEQLAEDLLNDACKSVQGQRSKPKSADAAERGFHNDKGNNQESGKGSRR